MSEIGVVLRNRADQHIRGLLLRKERRGLIAEIERLTAELHATNREADTLAGEVERLRRVGWLAWCGWVNKKRNFAKRMERLRDVCVLETNGVDSPE